MDSALRVVKGEQSESGRHSAVPVINNWIRKQLQVTFNIVMDDLMPESDSLRYSRATTWLAGGAMRWRTCSHDQLFPVMLQPINTML